VKSRSRSRSACLELHEWNSQHTVPRGGRKVLLKVRAPITQSCAPSGEYLWPSTPRLLDHGFSLFGTAKTSRTLSNCRAANKAIPVEFLTNGSLGLLSRRHLLYVHNQLQTLLHTCMMQRHSYRCVCWIVTQPSQLTLAVWGLGSGVMITEVQWYSSIYLRGLTFPPLVIVQEDLYSHIEKGRPFSFLPF
jgi:hypothetical protein